MRSATNNITCSKKIEVKKPRPRSVTSRKARDRSDARKAETKDTGQSPSGLGKMFCGQGGLQTRTKRLIALGKLTK
jgi:hypothetical protein